MLDDEVSLGLAEASECDRSSFAGNDDLPKRSVADGIRLQRNSPGSHMWELEGLITARDVDHVHLVLGFQTTLQLNKNATSFETSCDQPALKYVSKLTAWMFFSLSRPTLNT